MYVEIDDSVNEDLLSQFPLTNEFIDEKRISGNVFVHCVAGVSRSATIVTAYLMKINKWSTERALEYVNNKR